MRLARAFGALVAACAAAAAAAGARGDVDVALGNGDRLTGTLSPAGEVETVRVQLPRGAKLTVSVAGKKPRGSRAAAPTTTFRVLGPGDAEVLPFQPTKGSGASVRNHVVETGGEHRIEVKGDGERVGEYVLNVRWTPPRGLPIAGDLSTSDLPLLFDADAGARATFLVRAASGSPAHPRFLTLSADGFHAPFVALPPEPTSHRVANVLLPVSGRYLVTIVDAAGNAASGPVVGSISIRPPKPLRRKVVITDAKIGGAGESAFGQVVGAGGGTLEVDDTPLAIEGAKVEVPAGALPFPTALVLGTGEDLPPKTGLTAAGPAIFCGPDGLKFAEGKPALMTLPFDPSSAGEDRSRVTVFVRDASGKVREVAFEEPYPLVDFDAGLVTFPTSHFSTYQVFLRTPATVRGDLDGDGFGDLVVPAAAASFAGSAAGRVYVFRGGPSLSSRSAAAADLILDGTGADDEFGRAVLVADANGDGFDDLVVSGRAPYRVAIWFGGPGFLSGGAPDREITAAAGDDNFGIRLAAAELNGDGRTDLIVGDESNSRQEAVTGAAFVFFGPIAQSGTSSAADVTILGASEGDLFGAALAAGDVVAPPRGNDGAADLIVGADQADNGGEGRVYVFRGPLSAGTRAADSAELVLVGDAPDDGFGLQLAVADLDGTGLRELVVAAAGVSLDETRTQAGAAYVFRDGARVATITGAAGADELGKSLAVGPVLGGAARDVVFVGAPGWDTPTGDSGAVAVVATAADLALGAANRLQDPAGAAGFGLSLATADVNGDGRPDLIAAAPYDSTGGGESGRVYVFLGGASFTFPRSTSTAEIVIRGAAGERLGGR